MKYKALSQNDLNKVFGGNGGGGGGVEPPKASSATLTKKTDTLSKAINSGS